MVSRALFGTLLVLVEILYLWLAFESVRPMILAGDVASYIMSALFLAAGVGAAVAGMNLVRAKRR